MIESILLMAVFLTLGVFSSRKLARLWNPMGFEEPPFQTVRGTSYLNPWLLARHLARLVRSAAGAVIAFLGMTLPHSILQTGVMIVGTAGTGKSRLLIELIESITKRVRPGSGERAIIFDPKNEFVSILFRLAHPDIPIYILNPFDARGTRWRIAADVQQPASALTLAMALIPEVVNDANAFFSKAARAIVSGVILVLNAFAGETWTLRQLIAIVKNTKLMRAILSQRPETAPLVDLFLSGKVGRDVAATASASLDAFSTAAAAWDRADGDISIDEILSTECIVILGWDDAIGPALSAIYGLFLELFINRALQNQDRRKRCYLLIDELRMLPKSCGQALNRAAFRGRSSAICPIVAFQDWNSLIEVYGQAGAAELAANFQTKIFLRLGSTEAAEWAAGCLGKPEARWETEGRSYVIHEFRERPTTYTQTLTGHVGDRYLIHPAQLRNLPLADPKRDRIVGYWISPILPGPASFIAPFQAIARRCTSSPDFPDVIRRPITDQIGRPFMADDADALNLPTTDDLLAALASGPSSGIQP